jgi:multidrug efflux pump
VDGINSIYATSGGQSDTLNSQGGVPVDNIGNITIELKDYHERRNGKAILEDIRQRTANIPGVHVEVRVPQQGPPTGKDVMIDVSGDDYVALAQVTGALRQHMDAQKELRDVEDTRPLPGIEWDLDIDRVAASRFGANALSIGTAVQLVTDGIFVGEYRPDDADQQVDIRVRYPARARGIHALDDVRVATAGGMVPASNFVTLKPGQQVNSIERVDGHRVYHVRANMKAQCSASVKTNCVAQAILPSAEADTLKTWIATQHFPNSVSVTFKGGQEQQDESMAFLKMAALMALFLIGIVLLALFNSFYHTGLILIAVILAMIGSLLGMVVMGQAFSVIMTGTGMLALAGIVVNHNIVLIDTFHRLRDAGMDPIEAVIRSSAQRLRPVFLTTITAIGGLLPMMLAIEINFWTREITIGGPNGMMWVQLSTAIVFGLAFSKMITLGLVPAMLAMPYRFKAWRERRRGGRQQPQAVVGGNVVRGPRPMEEAAE